MILRLQAQRELPEKARHAGLERPGTRIMGHYNEGRCCITHGQLDFVGGGPQL